MCLIFVLFFSRTRAPTKLYTLSLHDALPIYPRHIPERFGLLTLIVLGESVLGVVLGIAHVRSEEHTSELQSRVDLVCRLLLEKKKLTMLSKTDALDDKNKHNMHVTIVNDLFR